MSEENGVKYYTLEEVAKNNGKDTDKVWIIYKDSVYDVTDYLDEHPGGGELITEWAGVDCTKEFDKAGHSRDAMKDFKKYKIGEIVEEEKKKPKKVESKSAANGNQNPNKPVQRSCINIITCGLIG